MVTSKTSMVSVLMTPGSTLVFLSVQKNSTGSAEQVKLPKVDFGVSTDLNELLRG